MLALVYLGVYHRCMEQIRTTGGHYHDPSGKYDYCDDPACNQFGAYESCGCLTNKAGAHRVGCPDYPEGVRGDAAR